MSNLPFPGMQHMASHDYADIILRAHENYKRCHNATDADCMIAYISPIPAWDKSGLKTSYKLVFTSYIGWKVYMMHSGGFGYIPACEENSNDLECVP